MIKLTETLIERLNKALELIHTDVTKEELNLFYSVYSKLQIKLFLSAVEFFKKYAGSFREKYIVLEDSKFNDEVCLDCYVPLLKYHYSYVFDSKKLEENALREIKDLMDFIDEVKNVSKRDVIPIARIGYYYPADVFIDEEGLLYCLYEF